MSYWASGEFDEHGNYILPRTWDSLPYEPPKALTIDIDLDKIKRRRDEEREKAFKSREYFDWSRMYSYANLAVEFYWQTLAAFNKFYVVDKIDNLPQKFEGWQNLASIANRLNEYEDNLVSQYGKTDRDVLVAVKRHKDLKNVVNYASLAWVMYHLMLDKHQNIVQGVDLSALLKDNKNLMCDVLTTDEEKLVELNQLVTLKNKINNQLPANFLNNEHGYLYSKVDSLAIYDRLMTLAGGLTRDEIAEKINNLSNRENYSHDVGLIINFYLNKQQMLHSAKILDRKVENWQSSMVKNLNAFLNEEGIDIFKKILSYRERLNECYRFAKANLDEQIVADVVKVGKTISASLKAAEPSYNEFLEEDKRAEELVEKLKLGQ